MRFTAVLSLVLTLNLTAIAAQTPKNGSRGQRPMKQYSMEEFMATTSVTGATFSADGSRVLFSSNESGIFNVYCLPVTGGKPGALTKSTTDSTFAVSYFPHDDRILYTRDAGGNEQNHLYVLELDGKERDLTPGAKLKAQFGNWSQDGKAFFVLTNERDGRFFDIYRYDAKTYERILFYKEEKGYQPSGGSNDEKWIALAKVNTTSDSDLFLYNIGTQEFQHITPHREPADYKVAGFDPASEWLYYLTNDGGEFTRVRRYHLASGRHEEVEKATWDISYSSFSHRGRYRVTGVNEDGRTVITVIENQTGKTVPLPKLPAGEITSVHISRDEKQMAFYLNGDRAPSNLYVYNFSTAQALKLTDTLSKAIDPLDLVESAVVRFKSFDGLTIPSIYYKPHQALASNKVPALVWVHGGPGGQTRKGYSPIIQYLVNHGYAVLGINNRGSSGYGKTFYVADDQKHGREPLWDCVEGKKYLASLPYVDPDRIAIIGGSYGGYMVLAALAFQPEVFAAGIDIFGVSNWLRTLESMPVYWEPFRVALYKEMGDPVKDKEMLRAISPLFHADKIRKPLMVLQGANDPRVIQAESDDIVAAVKKNGVPVEYVVFPDEGHGFAKKKNQIEGYSAILKFLDQHLRGR